MANQTIVSVPPKFQDLKQVRAFTIKLVEKLDLVLGYRGSTSYEAAGTAESLTNDALTFLNKKLTDISNTIDSLLDADNRQVDATTELTTIVEALKPGTAVADLTYTAPTISVAYSQAEVQGLADDIKVTSDKIDEVMAVLKTIGILS